LKDKIPLVTATIKYAYLTYVDGLYTSNGTDILTLHHPVSHLSTNRYVAVSNWQRLYSYSLHNSL